MDQDKNTDEIKAARNAANIKLAVGLGILAAVIYFGFIFLQYTKSAGM